MTPQDRIEMLKRLWERPTLTQGFAGNETEFQTWASDVAPLLKYDPRYYDEFRQYAKKINSRFQGSDFYISCLNRMMAIIREAIADLSVNGEPMRNFINADELAREAKSERGEMGFPDKVTLAWLWNHVPWGGWASLITAFVFVFGFGVSVGQSNWYYGLISHHASITNFTNSTENTVPLNKSSVGPKVLTDKPSATIHPESDSTLNRQAELPKSTDSAQARALEPPLVPSTNSIAAPIREASAREVIAHLNSLPPLQRSEIESKAYVGRLVSWKGLVLSVDKVNTGFMVGLAETDGRRPLTIFRFDTQWRERLDVLRRGDVISIQGKIYSFDGGGVIVDGTAFSLVSKSKKKADG